MLRGHCGGESVDEQLKKHEGKKKTIMAKRLLDEKT
jgi:hypothetical protein